MYVVKTPFLLRWIYPDLVWKKPAAKTIYLTFDDGPIPHITPFVLKTLREFNARATFFCIGDNVVKHPDVYQEVLNSGNSVGNHTYNHLRGWDTDDEEYLENVAKCAEVVKSKLFRPPYGRIKKNQIIKLKAQYPELEIIMWDILSGDFDQNLDPETCLKKLTDKTRPGSIVVFHDSVKAFKRLEYVLPRALKFWQQQGFLFERL